MRLWILSKLMVSECLEDENFSCSSNLDRGVVILEGNPFNMCAPKSVQLLGESIPFQGFRVNQGYFRLAVCRLRNRYFLVYTPAYTHTYTQQMQIVCISEAARETQCARIV